MYGVRMHNNTDDNTDIIVLAAIVASTVLQYA
jgi:hypothetical protein